MGPPRKDINLLIQEGKQDAGVGGDRDRGWSLLEASSEADTICLAEEGFTASSS